MNSIDTKQTGFGRSSILSDSTTKMDNQADNDDDFDVYDQHSRILKAMKSGDDIKAISLNHGVSEKMSQQIN